MFLRQRSTKSHIDAEESRKKPFLLEEHEQITLVDELRKQARQDYEFQRKSLKILCLLFAGISLYLSEFHGIHVSLPVR